MSEGPRPLPGFRELEVGGGAVQDAALRRRGWTRRFLAAPPRLAEVKALYESMGLEVRFELPGLEELPSECGACPAASALFRVVYTRGKRSER